jgi:hypothetical protein
MGIAERFDGERGEYIGLPTAVECPNHPGDIITDAQGVKKATEEYLKTLQEISPAGNQCIRVSCVPRFQCVNCTSVRHIKMCLTMSRDATHLLTKWLSQRVKGLLKYFKGYRAP